MERYNIHTMPCFLAFYNSKLVYCGSMVRCGTSDQLCDLRVCCRG